MDQGTRNAEGAGQQRDRGDNLANINPDDIESMVVLKGSTAAALYGSRAAAGAIIITTKSGSKNSGIGVDFTSSYTTSQALNFMDEITQTEYGQGQAGNKFTTAAQIQGNGQFGWGAKLDGQPTMNYDGVMRPYSAYPNQLFDFLQNGNKFYQYTWIIRWWRPTEVSGRPSQPQMQKVLYPATNTRGRFST